MKKVIVDFEMNPIAREYKSIRKQYKQEIIEIGAIMLDEDLNEIATYKAYVRPSYSKEIELKITELTGIETYHVHGARRIDEVLDLFANWCIEKSDNDFAVYAWSENDLNQINREIELNGFEVSSELRQVIDSWIDLQLEYCNAIGSDRAVGLTKALESLGIFFDGKMHDALDDSRNRARRHQRVGCAGNRD